MANASAAAACFPAVAPEREVACEDVMLNGAGIGHGTDAGADNGTDAGTGHGTDACDVLEEVRHQVAAEYLPVMATIKDELISELKGIERAEVGRVYRWLLFLCAVERERGGGGGRGRGRANLLRERGAGR